MTDLNEKALEAATEAAHEHLEIDGDVSGPFIRLDSVENAVEAAIHAYLEAATPPAVAGLDIDALLQPLEDIYVRDGFCDWADVANARNEIRTALRLSAGGGQCAGQWKEIETVFQLKGRRTSPAYFPTTGEVCEVSGPNCDDANGYTWMKMTILWQNDKFVLYGMDGFWPNLHKHEHVLFRPLPASPTVEAGHVE